MRAIILARRESCYHKNLGRTSKKTLICQHCELPIKRGHNSWAKRKAKGEAKK